MQDRVRLLGVLVDAVSTDAASDAAIKYIEEENTRVVYLVNSETLILLEKNDEGKALLGACDMVLPGTVSVSTGIDDVLGLKRDPFFLESYFDNIFEYAVANGKEMQLIAGSEEQFQSVKENIHEKWSYLTLSGAYFTEQEPSYEHIVNEINSIAPDILILALNESIQRQLLKEYRNQMNAGLMIFTGNILYNKAVSEAKLPETVEKLRIGNLYKWLRKDSSGKNFFNNIRMKFRLLRDK